MTTQSATDVVTCDVRDNGVAELRLNRPHVSNTFDLPTAHALGRVVDELGGNGDVRAILLTGAGKRFCAGGDMNSFAAAQNPSGYLNELAKTLDGVLQRFAQLEVPVVACVQGAVAGAGLAVMLSCDIIIAERTTKFVAAYSSIGLTPDCGLSYLLPRVVGQVRALDLLLSGRAVGAEEALAWGLVTELSDAGAARERADDVATQLASGPTFALGQAKLLARSSWEHTLGEVGAREAAVIARAVVEPDAQQLITTFLGR
jgi:2-(1,2-epoxy-1,2-dihydrophenyl)acetyl-CoA isomerase